MTSQGIKKQNAGQWLVVVRFCLTENGPRVDGHCQGPMKVFVNREKHHLLVEYIDPLSLCPVLNCGYTQLG